MRNGAARRYLAEIVGYGMSGDAYHITAPAENGDGAYRVMRAAIRDAHIEAGANRICQCSRHLDASGRCHRDSGHEAACFGEHSRKIAVSSTKSMTGHLLGGAGGLEAGISVLALRDQSLPPTINQETPDPDCDLDYIPNHMRKAAVEYALSNSFGFGGTNAASTVQALGDPLGSNTANERCE